MVARKDNNPDTRRPQCKSTGGEHAIRQQIRGRQSVVPAPRDGAKPSVASPDQPSETDDYGSLMKRLGTTDRDFAKGLFGQLFSASGRGADKFDGDGFFFALAVIKDLKPRDELEAMQLAQMAAVHAALMRAAGQLARAEYLTHLDSATRAVNQLARTYTAQLEGLKRYRSGLEQKVTVQNVSVTEGGQAIVGNVNQARHGAAPEELANAMPALADARQAAMEILGRAGANCGFAAGEDKDMTFAPIFGLSKVIPASRAGFGATSPGVSANW